MSSQNTVFLKAVLADGMSYTLSDIFVEPVEYREKSCILPVFPHKKRADFLQ